MALINEWACSQGASTAHSQGHRQQPERCGVKPGQNLREK